VHFRWSDVVERRFEDWRNRDLGLRICATRCAITNNPVLRACLTRIPRCVIPRDRVALDKLDIRTEQLANSKNSSSSTAKMTTDDGIAGRSRISIGIHAVDERVAERRGNVETGTYTARCLHADLALPPRKACRRTVHEYEQTGASLAGEKPGVGGYPRRPETGISDEDGVAVSGSLLLSRGISTGVS